MYQPNAFRETRPQVLADFMRAYPFATIVSPAAEGFTADHLPLELAEGGLLLGHIARGNAMSRMDGAEVLAVFHGPQGYISPNWYPSKRETGREVPTWNYAVVHVHGSLRVIDEAPWLLALLERLTERHEAYQPQPWHVADAPAEYIQNMLHAIVGIEIRITRVEGKFKLSQNHPPSKRDGVIEGLRARGAEGDLALAHLMSGREAASP